MTQEQSITLIPSCIHLHLINNLIKFYDIQITQTIDKKQILQFFKCKRVAHILYSQLLDEFEGFGFIKQINRLKYTICLETINKLTPLDFEVQMYNDAINDIDLKINQLKAMRIKYKIKLNKILCL